MSRRKYLYRVTAHYSKQFRPLPEPPKEWTATRHYQSLSAAQHRARVLSEGVPSTYDVPGIPKAERVTIERSEPVTTWQDVEQWTAGQVQR